MTNMAFLILTAAVVIQSGHTPETGRSSRERQVASLERQAEAGDLKAQVQLGLAYASGYGMPVDEAEAVKWFRKAAEKGDPPGEYLLSEMYFTGRGVEVDMGEALKWLTRSAEHGDPHAQSNLGALYLRGQVVPKDEVEAARWIRKAADQGLSAGQFELGSLYAHGMGVSQSETEAAAWYRKAADQGDTPAMNNLAYLQATSGNPKVRNTKEAVLVAQRAAEIEPNNATYLDTLATAFFEAGQPDKATEAEQRAMMLSPENPSYKKALQKYQAANQHTQHR